MNSFIRGLHIYQDVWTPAEVLLLKREPENVHDKYAVAVIMRSDNTTVGHIPYNLAPIVSPFLARNVNKAVAEVTGEPGRWIWDGSPLHLQTLRTSKIRRPFQRSHFKVAE